jgi:hypothetical protein
MDTINAHLIHGTSTGYTEMLLRRAADRITELERQLAEREQQAAHQTERIEAMAAICEEKDKQLAEREAQLANQNPTVVCFRVLRPPFLSFAELGWCYSFRDHFELHWDDGQHEMWRAELSTDGTRMLTSEEETRLSADEQLAKKKPTPPKAELIPPTDEREQFEAWATAKGSLVTREPFKPDSYIDIMADFAWPAWQAAAPSQQMRDDHEAMELIRSGVIQEVYIHGTMFYASRRGTNQEFRRGDPAQAILAAAKEES